MRPSVKWCVLAGLLLLKLALLVAWGPVRHLDTRGYEAFAAEILAGPEWLAEAELDERPIAKTAFRAPGYPLLLAALRGGEGWLLVLLQIALSLVATAAFFDLALALGGSRWLAATAAVAQATSMTLVLDQSLLSDSVASSLLLFFLCRVGSVTLSGGGVGAARALAWGGLLALTLLVRESTSALALFLLLPVALAGARGGTGWLRAVAWTAAPLVLVAALWMGWNQARLGSPVLTTGRQTILLQPLLEARRAGVPVFEGADPLSTVGATTHHQDPIAEVFLINDRLHAEHGQTGLDIAAANRARLLRVCLDHPIAMTRLALGRYGPPHVAAVVQRLESVAEIIHRTEGERPWGIRKVVLLGGGRLWLQLAEGLMVLLAFAAMATLLVVVPAAALVRRRRGVASTRSAEAVLIGAVVYVGFVAAHLPIHLEPRYLAPVAPLALLAVVERIGAWRGSSRGLPRA